MIAASLGNWTYAVPFVLAAIVVAVLGVALAERRWPQDKQVGGYQSGPRSVRELAEPPVGPAPGARKGVS